MKQKLLNNLRLRVCMLVAVMCAVASGNAWAEEVLCYTLTPANGSNNSYAGYCDIEIDGITWNLTGNSTMNPWRIGGKSLTGVNRELYSKTAISDNISKIEVTHGAASSITVNSWTVIVASDADFSNVVSTLTPEFTENTTTTIERPEGKDWSNCYYKFVYNVTVSGSSNKFVEFTEAKFYKEAAADTRTATTTTIEALFDDTDLYTAREKEGLVEATVKAGETVISGATVTWSSSDEDVATVDEDGVVTLIAAGSTTITATYGGDATYQGSSAEYVLTLTDSTPFEGGDVTLVAGTDKGSTTASNSADEVSKSVVTMSSTDAAFATAEYRFYKDSKTTFTTTSGKITKIEFTGASSNYPISGFGETEGLTIDEEENTGTWTGSAKSVSFTASGKQVRASKVVVTVSVSESVAIASATGYATFASDNDLDFTSADAFKVFYATCSGSVLTFHKINKVAAGTGVLLVSANGGAVAATNVPFLDGTADATTGNVFVRGAGAAVSYTDAAPIYVLSVVDNVLGFYQADDNSVATNRAYIQVPAGGSVKSFAISLDEADAVSAVKAVNGNADIFNLAGQRVSKAQRGLYIVGGKKVFVK